MIRPYQFFSASKLLAALWTLFLILSPDAFADGLVRDLPSTGDWSSYRMTEQWSDGTERELKVTIKRLASTPDTPVDQAWIEIVFETLDGKTRSAYRFLTPVESFASGDPMTAAVDVWVRKHDGDSARDMDWGNFLPRLSLVCMPKLTDETRKDETETVTINEQALVCSVVTGMYSKAYDSETANANCVIAINDRIPFGVAHATFKMRCISKCDPDPNAQCNLDTGTVEFFLQEFGHDAVAVVSVEPDHSR